MSVHPRLDARTLRDNPNRVPAVVDEEVMSVVDLLLRREPARAHPFAVQEAARREPGIEAAHFDLRAEHATGGVVEAAAVRHRLHLAANLDALVGDLVDHCLELELEVAELARRAEERIHTRAGLDGAPDDGALFDGVGVRAVEMDPAVERLAVEERGPCLPAGLRSGGYVWRVIAKRERNNRVP